MCFVQTQIKKIIKITTSTSNKEVRRGMCSQDLQHVIKNGGQIHRKLKLEIKSMAYSLLTLLLRAINTLEFSGL